MAKDESPREAALLRITQQEAQIAKQKALIANLKANGTSIGTAKRMLAQMEDRLKTLRDYLCLYPK